MKSPTMIIIILLGLAIFFACIVYKTDNNAIDRWASDNHVEVINREQCVFSIGPYWIKDRNQRIYRLSLDNNKVFYMRTGVFGNEFLEWDK